VTATDVIPTHLHGFSVEIGTDNDAMWAKLRPSTPLTHDRMNYLGRAMILAKLPLAPEAIAQIRAGNEAITEEAAAIVLTEASKLARHVGTA